MKRTEIEFGINERKTDNAVKRKAYAFLADADLQMKVERCVACAS